MSLASCGGGRRAIFCKSDDLKAGNIWSVRSMETVEMHSFTHTGGIVRAK